MDLERRISSLEVNQANLIASGGQRHVRAVACKEHSHVRLQPSAWVVKQAGGRLAFQVPVDRPQDRQARWLDGVPSPLDTVRRYYGVRLVKCLPSI